MRLLLSLTLALVGCASAAPAPSHCDRNARAGTYLETSTLMSGSCGAMPDALVTLTADNGVGPGCHLNHEAWSEGDCKLERDITCGGAHAVTVSRAATSNGSEISGTMTMTTTTCVGTYALELVRQ